MTDRTHLTLRVERDLQAGAVSRYVVDHFFQEEQP